MTNPENEPRSEFMHLRFRPSVKDSLEAEARKLSVERGRRVSTTEAADELLAAELIRRDYKIVDRNGF